VEHIQHPSGYTSHRSLLSCNLDEHLPALSPDGYTKGDAMSDLHNLLATRRRPTGVSIIAVLVAIGGIITLIGAIYLFFGVGVFAFQLPGSLRGVAIWFGILAAIIGLLELFFAWGLWTLKSWAFWAVVILEVLNIIQILILWLQHYSNFGSFLLSLVLPVVILVYFLADRHVREAFGT
jgi:uncharacterized membrane protein (DUF2068 family)